MKSVHVLSILNAVLNILDNEIEIDLYRRRKWFEKKRNNNNNKKWLWSHAVVINVCVAPIYGLFTEYWSECIEIITLMNVTEWSSSHRFYCPNMNSKEKNIDWNCQKFGSKFHILIHKIQVNKTWNNTHHHLI